MTKRIFLIHGWDGHPENCFFPYLKKELEKQEVQIIIPAMPHSETPKIREWVSHLAKIVGMPDKETFFIGHSIGCQTILRYIQKINTQVGGIVLIAPWITLTNMEKRGKNEIKIAAPWIETPIQFETIKKRAKNIVAIFSDNDPEVPISNADVFKEKLGAKIIIEKDKGHFSDDANVKSLPSALREIKEMIE